MSRFLIFFITLTTAVAQNTGDWMQDYSEANSLGTGNVLVLQEGTGLSGSDRHAKYGLIRDDIRVVKVFPDDFGGSAVGGFDNNAALTAAHQDGLHVYFRPGVYEFTGTLNLWNTNGCHWEGPARFYGEAELRCMDSPATTVPGFHLNRVRECTYERIKFASTQSNTTGVKGFYIDNDEFLPGAYGISDTAYYNTTTLRFSECRFVYRSSGVAQVNSSQVWIGSTTRVASAAALDPPQSVAASVNNDMHCFEQCEFSTNNNLPWRNVTLTGQNTHSINFNQCQFNGSSGNVGSSAIYGEWEASPTFFNNCVFLGHSIAFHMPNTHTHGWFVRDCNSEGIKTLISVNFSSANKTLFVLDGGRHYSGNASGANWIIFKPVGNLNIYNVDFGYWSQPAEDNVKIVLGDPASTQGPICNFIGNQFSHDSAFTNGDGTTWATGAGDNGAKLGAWLGNMAGVTAGSYKWFAPPGPIYSE